MNIHTLRGGDRDRIEGNKLYINNTFIHNQQRAKLVKELISSINGK